MYRPTEYETTTITFPAEITARILVCVCLLGQSIGILIPHTSRNTPIRRHVASPEYMSTAVGKGPPRVFHRKTSFQSLAQTVVCLCTRRVLARKALVLRERTCVCHSLTSVTSVTCLPFLWVVGGRWGNKLLAQAKSTHTHAHFEVLL
jgi:hypothetical protein